MVRDEIDADLARHPKLFPLLELWHRKRRGRVMPARRDFDTLELWAWLGHLILVETLGGAAYRYRVYGTRLVDLFGHELTGAPVAPFASNAQPLIVGDYESVRRTRNILYVKRAAVAQSQPILLQMLLLPLSANAAEVDMILAAVYWSALDLDRPRFSSLRLLS